jgi:hypothetical protein
VTPVTLLVTPGTVPLVSVVAVPVTALAALVAAWATVPVTAVPEAAWVTVPVTLPAVPEAA